MTWKSFLRIFIPIALGGLLIATIIAVQPTSARTLINRAKEQIPDAIEFFNENESNLNTIAEIQRRITDKEYGIGWSGDDIVISVWEFSEGVIRDFIESDKSLNESQYLDEAEKNAIREVMINLDVSTRKVMQKLGKLNPDIRYGDILITPEKVGVHFAFMDGGNPYATFQIINNPNPVLPTQRTIIVYDDYEESIERVKEDWYHFEQINDDWYIFIEYIIW